MKEKFYTSFLNDTVDRVAKAVKSSTPSPKSIRNKLAKEGTRRGKSKLNTSIVNSYEKSVVKNMREILDETIDTVVDSHIVEYLRASGSPKLTPEEMLNLRTKLLRKFKRTKFTKFKGLTPNQRIRNIAKNSRKDLKRSIASYVKHGRYVSIIDFEKNNINISNTHRLSAKRSNARLITSEANRARQDMGSMIAKEFGVEYVKWVTTNDNKVCPICREYSLSVSLPVDVDPTGDLRGVYRVDEAPEYPHPHCRCKKVPHLIRPKQVRVPDASAS